MIKDPVDGDVTTSLGHSPYLCHSLQKSDFFLAHQSFLYCRGTCWLPCEEHCSGFVMSFLKWQMQLAFLPSSILFARLNKTYSLVVSLSKIWPSLECTVGFYQCECTLLVRVALGLHWSLQPLQSCFPSLSWSCSRWKLCIFLCWISWSSCCQLTCLESKQLQSEVVQPW